MNLSDLVELIEAIEFGMIGSDNNKSVAEILKELKSKDEE